MQITDIQYLPIHRCPQCGAPAATAPTGEWLQPYQDWFGTAFSSWIANLGYVRFECACRFHGGRYPSLRVARLGDAIIPVEFVTAEDARQKGSPPAMVNAGRVRQAVAFLAQHADPQRTAGVDALAHTLYAVSAGAISPDLARQRIEQWVREQMGGDQPLALPIPISVDF